MIKGKSENWALSFGMERTTSFWNIENFLLEHLPCRTKTHQGNNKLNEIAKVRKSKSFEEENKKQKKFFCRRNFHFFCKSGVGGSHHDLPTEMIPHNGQFWYFLENNFFSPKEVDQSAPSPFAPNSPTTWRMKTQTGFTRCYNLSQAYAYLNLLKSHS